MTRDEIVAAARGWIGTPYRHQASLKGVGADCLGLVRGLWRDLIGPEPEAVPAYSPDWAEAGGRETLAAGGLRHMIAVPIEAAQPGDVVLYRFREGLPAKHAGLLVTADRMVHATERIGVVEVALGPWWRRRIAYAFAFPGIDT
ncbi:NlpC/P60 family protein [Segnochrobactrum spirostomi]|uniref:Peptidase P60 n=1 Tax=Segnochrobactrum spirostomi TaxID=2608987 RepID=A0A6A7Y109_9HYPH|nr:NlpC/P60 family protein [Segnochrobactrum spirostomi]MQT12316.1 peptidase P60 [Segnochrobactrum spirostomi]